MMYLGAPAWMLMTIAAASKMFDGDVGGIDVAFGIAMFFIMFAVSLVPKLLGHAGYCADARAARRAMAGGCGSRQVPWSRRCSRS